MRRAIGLLAAVALLVAASAALAATRSYEGAIKGDEPASVSLKLKRADGELAVRSFAAKDFLISCESGPARLKKASISGRVPVSDKGRFRIEGSTEGQELEVEGRLSGRRGAKGTAHYSGPTPVGERVETCDSGELRWTSSR